MHGTFRALLPRLATQFTRDWPARPVNRGAQCGAQCGPVLVKN